MTTPVHGIDEVPENTTNPAAGLNLALRQIETRICPVVEGFSTVAGLPATPADGEMWVMEDGPNQGSIAKYVAESDDWEYTAPELIRLLFSAYGTSFYFWVPGSPAGTWTNVS